MKIMVLLIIAVLLIIFGKRIVRAIKRTFSLRKVLITYHGCEDNARNAVVTPDEFITGSKIHWGHRFKKVIFETSLNSEVTPKQAYGILNFFNTKFGKKPNGAKITGSNTTTDGNGITMITWTFDRCPYRYGLSQEAYNQIMNDVKGSFRFVLADRHPVRLCTCKDAYETGLATEVNYLVRLRGWKDPLKGIRFDTVE